MSGPTIVIKPGKKEALQQVSLDDVPQAGKCTQDDPTSGACRNYTESARKWHNAKLKEMDKYVTGDQDGKQVTVSIWEDKVENYDECKQTGKLGWTPVKFLPWMVEENSKRTLQVCKSKLLGEGTKKEEDKKEEKVTEEKKETVPTGEIGVADSLEEVPDLTPQGLGDKFYVKMVDIFGRDEAGSVDLSGTYEEVAKNLKDYAVAMKAKYNEQFGEFKWAELKTKVKFEDNEIDIIGITPATAPDAESKKKIEAALKAAKEQVKTELKANYKAVNVTEPADLDEQIDDAKSGSELVQLATKLEKAAREAAVQKPFPEDLAKGIEDLPAAEGDWATMVQGKVETWVLRNEPHIAKFESYLDAVQDMGDAKDKDTAGFTVRYKALMDKVETERLGLAQDERDDFQDERIGDAEKELGLDSVKPRPDWDEEATPAKNAEALNKWVEKSAKRSGKPVDEFLTETGYKDPAKFKADIKSLAKMRPEEAEEKYEELTRQAVKEYGVPAKKGRQEGSLAVKSAFATGDKVNYGGLLLISQEGGYAPTKNWELYGDVILIGFLSTNVAMAQYNDYYGESTQLSGLVVDEFKIGVKYATEDENVTDGDDKQVAIGLEGPLVDDDLTGSTSLGAYGVGMNPLSGTFNFMLWYPCTGFGARLYWNADFAKNKGEDGKTTFTANVFGSLGYYFDQFAYSLTTFKPDEPIDGENIFNGLIGVELSGDVGGKEKRAENKYNKFSGIAYLQFGRGDMNVPELDGTSKTGVVQTEQSMLNLGVGVAFNQSRRLTRRSRAPKPDGVTASALFEAKIAGDRPTSSNEETESLWRIRGYLGYAFLLNSGINVIPSASAGYSHNNATIDLLECPGCSAEGSFPGEATTSTFNAVFGVKVVNVSLTDTLKAEVGGGAGVIYVDRGEQSEAGFVGSANGKLTW